MYPNWAISLGAPGPAFVPTVTVLVTVLVPPQPAAASATSATAAGTRCDRFIVAIFFTRRVDCNREPRASVQPGDGGRAHALVPARPDHDLERCDCAHRRGDSPRVLRGRGHGGARARRQAAR